MAATRVKIAAGAVLLLAAAAVLYGVLLGGTTHELNFRFIDAGQLVKGNLVEVSGRSIGSVDEITLTDDNQANVKVKLKGDDFWPLRRGTVGAIRAVGLSGVANRYIQVTPGKTGAEIPDGGIIEPVKTRPIVDLDQVLTALDAPTRKQLQAFIKNGASIFDDDTAQDANKAVTVLNPAVAQGHAVLSEIDRDTAVVGRLITTSAVVSKTLSGRRTDLQGAITNTARTLDAIAAERTSLQDALIRAPAFLRESGQTIQKTSDTFQTIKPVLRELRPTAAPLAAVLRQLPGFGREARPVVGQLRDLIPAARKGLDSVPPLDTAARPALASTSSALESAVPIAAGLRPYAPDVIGGLFNGFTGTTAGYYDANGHFARIQLVTGSAALSGALGAVAQSQLQTGLTARCPGAAVEPAPDKSNPFVADSSVCDPAQAKK